MNYTDVDVWSKGGSPKIKNDKKIYNPLPKEGKKEKDQNRGIRNSVILRPKKG